MTTTSVALPAAQQPDWCDHPEREVSRRLLANAPALVAPEDVAALRRRLGSASAGAAQVLQLGDCVESFHETAAPQVDHRLRVLAALADRLAAAGPPVVRIGRIGGQFAKPRSSPVERRADRELPAFRGHLVNGEEFDAAARRHDPGRMVSAYYASSEIMSRVDRARAATTTASAPDGPWSSHDALVMDYESALVREHEGQAFLGSTHLPWLGERTRAARSAHVALMSTIVNPVACKIGRSTDPEDVVRVCGTIDPDRRAGRLVLILRLGRSVPPDDVSELVSAVRSAGHRPVWLSDPMHGNTFRPDGGPKTRDLAEMSAEATLVRRRLEAAGEHPAGLHLEVAADDVTECIGGTVGVTDLHRRYLSLCDPRLNPEQAAELIDHWSAV